MQTLPTFAQALSVTLDAVLPLGDRPRRRSLEHSIGGRLAEPVLADRDQPPFDRATMDGFALRAADARSASPLRVVGDVAAGAAPTGGLGPQEAFRIATGAPVPRGADAVVRHERTSDGPHPHSVVIRSPSPLAPGDCIHPRGADARAGGTVISAGVLIEPHHVAIAAAVGVLNARIAGGPPHVCVLSTGDELRPAATPSRDLAPHQIRDSNLPLLQSCVPAFGAAVAGAAHVPDSLDVTIAAVRAALESADILVTAGGVSAGERDHLPAAFERCGVATVLRGAAIQPGRPVFIGVRADDRAVVVGLPGNPVSVLATAHLFLWPVIRRLAGAGDGLPWRTVTLAEAVIPNPRREAFRPAIIRSDGRVSVPPWSGSGDLMHTAPTAGLLALPMRSGPCEAGERLPFLPWAWNSK